MQVETVRLLFGYGEKCSVCVTTCMCRSELIFCFLRRITCVAGCWYIHGPPSVLSCYTLCRYSRPVLTTSNQKSGVVLHCMVRFPHARNSVTNRRRCCSWGSWLSMLAPHHKSVYKEVLFVFLFPLALFLKYFFVSWLWVWATILSIVSLAQGGQDNRNYCINHKTDADLWRLLF